MTKEKGETQPMNTSRDIDVEVAKVTKHWTPGKHPHDKTDGDFNVSQCSACGILYKTGTESCDCGSTLMNEIINPRVPSYSTQHHEAWRLVEWMIRYKYIDGFSLQWSSDKLWTCIMKCNNIIVTGSGKTEQESIANAAIATEKFNK